MQPYDPMDHPIFFFYQQFFLSTIFCWLTLFLGKDHFLPKIFMTKTWKIYIFPINKVWQLKFLSFSDITEKCVSKCILIKNYSQTVTLNGEKDTNYSHTVTLKGEKDTN